ncbi:MAG: helicase-related protein, partial [Longimicrobiales bacterium]
TALRPDTALPAPVLALLRAVLIRRTRPLVSDMLDRGVGQSVLRFPQRAPPAAVRYDLTATYPGVYEEAADLLESLTFAPFRTGSYTRRVTNAVSSTRATASGGAELLRILLLKRLESSVSALTASLTAQIRFLESFLDHLRTGRLLTPADHRSFRGSTETDAVQLFLGDVVLAEVPRPLDVRALELDACADLERLRAFRRRLGGSADRDPKVNRLFELLDGPLARERVLLFTEFRETATYLWTALRDRGGVGLIHGGGAYLGRSACRRREVIERFAPAANSAPPPPPREAVRILVATDVLAEGMNLQDARHVISYDLPWNPVRLVQRIGRIDRLGSPHDVIFTHAFLPDHGLERLLRLLERVRAKLHAIQAGVGIEPNLVENVTAETSTDSRVFLGRLSVGDATLLDEIERRDSAAFEIEERLRIAWLRHGEAHVPEVSTDAVPFAVMSLPHASDQDECMLLAIRDGEWVEFVRFNPHDAAIEVDPPCAFALLLDVLHTRQSECPATDSHRELLDCVFAHVRRVLSERTKFMRPNHSNRGRSATISRHLLAALAREPGGPDPELCARVESMLSRIGTGGPAGLEYDLAELIARDRTHDRISAARLCSAIESLLDPRAGGLPQRPPQPGDVELLAAIALRSAGGERRV